MDHGFLGTRASFMLDVIICSLVLVLPALISSIYLVRYLHRYALHKRIQLAITAALTIVVLLFELDMQRHGGFWVLAEGSAYYDSAFLKNLLRVHLTFSISTAVLWPVTALTAWRYFPSPVVPNVFAPKHKILAWITVLDMVATVVTGLMVYYFGFIA